MSLSASKVNASLSKGGLYETETQRLQKDADNFTKLLENEKRDEGKYKSMLEKEVKSLHELKDKLREKRPSTKEQKRKAATIKLLENQLHKEIVKYNQTVADNDKLRKEIDKLRKDKKAGEEVHAKLQRQLQFIDTDTMETAKDRNEKRRQIEQDTLSTIHMRAQYEKKKTEFNNNISTLKQRLKEKIEDQKEDERFHRGDATDGKMGGIANPLEIVSLRLDNWKTRVRHKKETLDKYIRHIGIIKDAFDQIKKATGIGSTQEIVVTFTKSHEQSEALNSHLNALEHDLDTIEEANRELRRELRAKEKTLSEYDGKQKDVAINMGKQQADLAKSIGMK
jgi:chromosome segregation ATPase